MFIINYRAKDLPGQPLKCSYDGNLKDLFTICRPRCAKKLFYQLLTIRVNELDNKKQFKCTWVSHFNIFLNCISCYIIVIFIFIFNQVGPNYKEEKELILYPNKNGKVENILEEAIKHVELSPEGSGKLRIVEVVAHKVSPGPESDMPLEQLSGTIPKYFRIEEIPRDELQILVC